MNHGSVFLIIIPVLCAVATAVVFMTPADIGTTNRAKKTLVSECLESGNVPFLTETEFTCKFKEIN